MRSQYEEAMIRGSSSSSSTGTSSAPAQSWLSFVHIYEAIIAVLTMRIQHIHHSNVRWVCDIRWMCVYALNRDSSWLRHGSATASAVRTKEMDRPNVDLSWIISSAIQWNLSRLWLCVNGIVVVSKYTWTELNCYHWLLYFIANFFLHFFFVLRQKNYWNEKKKKKLKMNFSS